MARPQFNDESIKASLQSILDEIHAIDNPDELNELRRIFRASVPLFSRAYVSAWLLKKAGISGAGELPQRRPAAPVHENSRTIRQPRPAREPREPREPKEKQEPREVRDDRSTELPASRADMTTLFVGIGRTRRVYPRDLMTLLVENCKLDRDSIGNIKILDNYSFVDISNEQAQAVIDTLNNLEYRGRTLSVNFAKKKE
jgi:hypothetical protein